MRVCVGAYYMASVWFDGNRLQKPNHSCAALPFDCSCGSPSVDTSPLPAIYPKAQLSNLRVSG